LRRPELVREGLNGELDKFTIWPAQSDAAPAA
jgi:hypothetical protein